MEHKLNIRGVNLGNWLVLEKWMNPALFEDVEAEDEYYLAQDLPAEVYAERIRRHRQEYITERDFNAIAAMGLNAVRIPVPYFIWGDRPPFIGCLAELDRAFDWAERYGLQILIDLHTVPGSQNAFDNGGISGVCKWAQSPVEVEFALNLLEKLAERYGQRAGLLGIQPLNEPLTTAFIGDIPMEVLAASGRYKARDPEMAKGSAPIKTEFLKQFYVDAYRRVRKHLGEDKYFVIQDAFVMKIWKDFMQEEEFRNVALDSHLYLHGLAQHGCEQSTEGYIKALKEIYEKDILEMKEYFPIICGEWCLANPYMDNLPDGEEKDQAYRALAEEALKTWRQGNGHFYWSYKLMPEDPKLAAWDLGTSVIRGWLPVESLKES